jgi:hypothetical protein
MSLKCFSFFFKDYGRDAPVRGILKSAQPTKLFVSFLLLTKRPFINRHFSRAAGPQGTTPGCSMDAAPTCRDRQTNLRKAQSGMIRKATFARGDRDH